MLKSHCIGTYYRVRKCSFRTPVEEELWSAEAELPPAAEAALQHSKAYAPLPPSGKGAGGEGLLPVAPSQRQTRQAPHKQRYAGRLGNQLLREADVVNRDIPVVAEANLDNAALDHIRVKREGICLMPTAV